MGFGAMKLISGQQTPGKHGGHMARPVRGAQSVGTGGGRMC